MNFILKYFFLKYLHKIFSRIQNQNQNRSNNLIFNFNFRRINFNSISILLWFFPRVSTNCGTAPSINKEHVDGRHRIMYSYRIRSVVYQHCGRLIFKTTLLNKFETVCCTCDFYCYQNQIECCPIHLDCFDDKIKLNKIYNFRLIFIF